MKNLLIGFVIILVIAIGVYFIFFINSDKPTDSNSNSDRNENHDDKNDSNDQVVDQFNPSEDFPDAGEISITLTDNGEESNEDRTMDYKFKNEENKEIALVFGSSMTYDFYITDENGEEVYRNSDDKSYMQVIKETNLAPDEEETFTLELPKLQPGDYSLTVILAAKGYSDNETSIDFTIE